MNRASAGRTVLAIAILIGFAALGIRLIPAYLQSWKFQGYLNDISEDPESAKLTPSVLEARVLDKAASIGVPLHLGDVQVERRRGLSPGFRPQPSGFNAWAARRDGEPPVPVRSPLSLVQGRERMLGADGLARFLRLHRSGHSDYTNERDGWQRDLSVDDIAEAIRLRRATKS